jgi:hypothetical protein
MKKGFGTPYMFRSYNLRRDNIDPLSRNPGEGFEFSVSEVAQATSGAPYYFRPSRRGHSVAGTSEVAYEVFTDGSFFVNNPSWEVFNEIMTMHERSEEPIGLFLSLGTGETKHTWSDHFWRSLWPSERSLRKALGSQAAKVHHHIVHESGISEYQRFSVEQGLENVALDEWKPRKDGTQTLKRIHSVTAAYLKQDEVIAKLRECARLLVDRRRLRAKTGRWETYALGIRYQCKEENCARKNWLFQNRNELIKHLRTDHEVPPPDLDHFDEFQERLNKGRVLESSGHEEHSELMH